MRGETPVPAVRQRRLIQSWVVSQIPFEQVFHLSVLYDRPVTPRALSGQAAHLEIKS